jgi:hypothetical protein
MLKTVVPALVVLAGAAAATAGTVERSLEIDPPTGSGRS